MEKYICELLRSFRSRFLNHGPVIFTEKGISDFVSEVDKGIEKEIYQQLKKRYPDVDFVGEEETYPISQDKYFILDPLDGTTNFLHQLKQSVISLAYVENQQVIFAVVYDPYFDEMFVAKKGQGFTVNGEKVTLQANKKLHHSLIGIGTTPYQKTIGRKMFPLFARIYQDTADIRRSGAAALDLAYLACGRIDGFIEADLKPWDYAAGILLIEEAQGIITNFSGGKLSLTHSDNVMAGKGNIHQYLQNLVKEERK